MWQDGVIIATLSTLLGIVTLVALICMRLYSIQKTINKIRDQRKQHQKGLSPPNDHHQTDEKDTTL